MSGQIFISYRREDAPSATGWLYERLSEQFARDQLFLDVDNIPPGIDFVAAIEQSVSACDVLIAVIGKRWLMARDEKRRRRLNNPNDFVRLEIATALKRGIRVIPVLVEGASIPRASDLPKDLESLVRRNALTVSPERFRADSDRLIRAVQRALEDAQVEQERKGEEQERAETEQREREQRERLEAERRQKEAQERLEAERRQREEQERQQAERREIERREQERLRVDQRLRAESEQLQAEERLEERLEALRRKSKGQERLEAERRQQAEQERLDAAGRPKETPAPEGKEAGLKARVLAALQTRPRLLVIMGSGAAILLLSFGLLFKAPPLPTPTTTPSNAPSPTPLVSPAAPSPSPSGADGFAQAKRYLDAKDYARALPLLQKAAEAGNAQAMYTLGWLYHYGDGVDQDYTQARQWYQRAAEAGNAQAMANLGWLYEKGKDVAKDYALARQWYQKAAEAGDVGAMNKLGDLYKEGLGGTQDYAQARQWYQKAADSGDEYAKRALAQLPSK